MGLHPWLLIPVCRQAGLTLSELSLQNVTIRIF
jgi:hypothetical protein